MKRSMLQTLLMASLLTLTAVALITNPKQSLEASIRGLNMWWEVVFPSLLPFFIVSELLIGYGVVSFLGVLLEPFMRPIFRIPGAGGFVWAMGMVSGFPAGAKLTARLRQEGQINQTEAERLVSFTNASNPLFIFGAVAVGFFHNPKLGILLAVSHYLGNLCVGLFMRFYKRHERQSKQNESQHVFILKKAFIALHKSNVDNKKPFGKRLGDALSSSIQTLLMIGGFIILFSVFNRLLSLVHITEILATFIQFFLYLFNIPKELAIPIVSGLLELTQGSQLASEAPSASLLDSVIVTSFILGFSGFSVHAQVASILAETDISFKPFFYGRIMQGFLSGVFTFLLWKPLYKGEGANQGAQQAATLFDGSSFLWAHELWNTLTTYGPVITIVMLFVYTCMHGYKLYADTNPPR